MPPHLPAEADPRRAEAMPPMIEGASRPGRLVAPLAMRVQATIDASVADNLPGLTPDEPGGQAADARAQVFATAQVVAAQLVHLESPEVPLTRIPEPLAPTTGRLWGKPMTLWWLMHPVRGDAALGGLAIDPYGGLWVLNTRRRNGLQFVGRYPHAPWTERDGTYRPVMVLDALRAAEARLASALDRVEAEMRHGRRNARRLGG